MVNIEKNTTVFNYFYLKSRNPFEFRQIFMQLMGELHCMSKHFQNGFLSSDAECSLTHK